MEHEIESATEETTRLAFSVFTAALDIDSAEVEGFISKSCGDDVALRAEVARLMKLHGEAEDHDFLATRTQFTLKNILDDPLVGHVMSGYKVEAIIGEGAMGRVYLAEQIKLRRKVALKVIHPHVMTPTLKKRFEHEARILARLHHHGIAQIFEAGLAETPRGIQPFFAMEYIQEACSITEHAGKEGLDTRSRLAMFCLVCDAVHYGHQRGVIHRDLKPDNILVSRRGHPKIVDYGVARAADRNALTTLQTSAGQLVGTLQYMSPEQCACDPEEIDARCDVYALGVLLYELICHRLPYNVQGLPLIEATRMIREMIPARPGTWERKIKGDIETIVLKSLEKQPSRRYNSAAALGDDIRRYLDRQPIIARPPSAFYQIQKIVHRHKALTASVFVIAILLAGSTVAVTMLAARLAQERDKAIIARNSASATTKFLQDILASGDPVRARHDLKVVDVLDEAARQLTGGFKGEPEVHASVCTTLGTSYRNLGLYEAATRQFEEALRVRRSLYGEHAPETLDSLVDIAEVHRLKGDFDAAEKLLVAVLDQQSQSLEGRQSSGRSLTIYAKTLNDMGSYAEAEAAFREAIKVLGISLGNDHVEVGTAMVDLVTTLGRQGKYQEAYDTNDQALAILLKHHAHDSPDVLSCRSVQGMWLARSAKFDEAEEQFLKVIELSRSRLGNVHEHIATSWVNVSYVRDRKGDHVGAEAALREALSIESSIRPDHPRVGNLFRKLGKSLMAQGKPEEAELVLREAFEKFGGQEVAPSEYLMPATIPLELGICLAIQNKLDEAETMFRYCQELLISYERFELEGAILRDKEEAQRDLYRHADLFGFDIGQAKNGK